MTDDAAHWKDRAERAEAALRFARARLMDVRGSDDIIAWIDDVERQAITARTCDVHVPRSVSERSPIQSAADALGPDGGPHPTMKFDPTSARKAAVLVERQRCAEIARTMDRNGVGHDGHDIADEIMTNTVKWSVYKAVRKGRKVVPVLLGYVNAPHMPLALDAACKRWPKERDSTQTQEGFSVRLFKTDPIRKASSK